MLPFGGSARASRRSRRWGRWLGSGAAVVVAGLTLGAARREHPAAPAVSATTRAGHPVRWTRAEIVLEPFARTSAALSAADLVTALEDGVREWNDALDDCGAPRLRVARAPSSVGRIRQDERSVVLVRTGTWCSDGARDRGDCYDDGRAAITRLYPVQSATSQRDGEIREADIELNAVDYRWSLDGDAAGTRSLRAIIAHELGHVLGLEHSCSASPKSRAAGKSIPLPSCSASEARASIMFPEPVESERRLVFAPGHSETATLCALYPRANSPWF